MVYRIVRGFIRMVLVPLLGARVVGVEGLDRPGPLILAPVHRSNLDSIVLASFSARRIRALGKESLFTVPVLSWLVSALGAIPVRRGEGDREALKAATQLLTSGEAMIVFPEGARQRGDGLGELFTGTAWLAAKTGAPVVPIGIVGTADATSSWRRLRRPNVRMVVGEPMAPPVAANGRRVGRDELRRFTAELLERLEAVQAEAVAQSQGGPHRRR